MSYTATVIVLDLIAGLLVGIHLWVPEKYRKLLDNWLITKLRPSDGQIDEKTVKGSFLFTLLFVIGIMTWGYFVDISKSNFTSEELIFSSLLVTAGIPIAAIAVVLIIIVYQKLKFIHKVPLVSIISVCGVVGSLSIVLVKYVNESLDRVVIGFAFSLIFMTLLIQVLPMARRFFTFESGVLARIGVTLFVIGKVIQLWNI